MATEAASGHHDRPVLILGLLLVVATLAVFGRSLANDFVNYDDPQYVTDNPHVKDGITLDGVRWAVSSTDYLNWHPLTWLSLQLDAELYGLEPWGFHLTAVLLHSANALLLFLILRQMTGALWPSGFVAALFALHPLHVESVAWVAERKDVLSTLFGLLAIAAYLRYVERPAWWRYLLVVLPTALSLAAKPMWVTLPGVLLLLDYWPLGRLRPSSARAVLLEKVPLLALAAAAGVATVIAQQRGGAVEPLELFPWDQRVGNAVVSYVRYLGMTICPAGLAPFYPHPRGNLPAWQIALAAGLLLSVTATAGLLRRRRPYLAVGWFWYLGTLVPMIGLVQVGEQALADRYTYLPLIGIFIMVAFGLSDLLRSLRFPRALVGAAAIAVILACAALTWKQIDHWHDSRTLWAHAVAVTADNYLAENNLGGACLAGQGTPAEAEEHFRNAVRILPTYARAWARLGIAVDRQGRTAEAAGYYFHSLELAPDQPRVHNNLAVSLAKLGKLDEAIHHLQEATRLEPDFAEAQFNLAGALEKANRPDEAIAAARQCVRLDPRNSQYELLLARLVRAQLQR